MYRFSELKIEHAVVQNISVVVLPMSNLHHADGLLGMNFLREFDFKLEQDRAVLAIE
ncbi:hypothetical protein RS130_20105 [Paraglaciecola aquimarina]|uniref:Uncharacterized protein n=1 Tax=Paraglaciecola aquimarina TaxID=1235557 RepID=A0ABU3T0U4_9ALTE|nr:hypothetical protein [Paraglaciecola aquimarina]MDU0355884.1 hypothetical protein [Paraglaciecola aquimarina]